ncbi:MAG TPA: hypothetical protein VFV83_03265 [Chthoniobacteraceae bacterium]|nr:hypothetical protein [Chthoniobacteraceae bacterium]
MKIVEKLESPGTGFPETMSALTTTLIEEITNAPEIIQRKVFDFLAFLKARQFARPEGAENLLHWRGPSSRELRRLA